MAAVSCAQHWTASEGLCTDIQREQQAGKAILHRALQWGLQLTQRASNLVRPHAPLQAADADAVHDLQDVITRDMRPCPYPAAATWLSQVQLARTTAKRWAGAILQRQRQRSIAVHARHELQAKRTI
jgi:hypothetical protein